MKYLLFFGFSVGVFSWLVAAESNEFKPYEILILFGLLAIVNVVQLAVVAGVRRVCAFLSEGANLERMELALLSVLTAINAYFFAVSAIRTAFLVQCALAAGIGAIYFVFNLSPRNARFGARLTVIFFMISVVTYATVPLFGESPPKTVELSIGPIVERKNVYLIGFDALISREAGDRLYGGAALPHYDYLRRSGFRTIDRAYSADWNTRPSFSRMFNFDWPVDVPAKAVGRLANLGGNAAAFRRFAANGYRTQYLFSTGYFGDHSDSIDFYFPKPGFGICKFLNRDFFYFICHPAAVAFINGAIFDTKGIYSNEEQADVLRRRTMSAARDEQPWFTFNYLYHPGHTNLDHDYRSAEQRAKFSEGFLDRLGRMEPWLEKTVGHVLAEDPDSVVLVMGDHGAWLTRGMSAEQILAGTPEFGRAEAIEDRYGVTLAVYPADFCAQRIGEGVSTLYLLRSVLQCLAGENEPTAREREESRWIWVGETRVDLRDVFESD